MWCSWMSSSGADVAWLMWYSIWYFWIQQNFEEFWLSFPFLEEQHFWYGVVIIHLVGLSIIHYLCACVHGHIPCGWYFWTFTCLHVDILYYVCSCANISFYMHSAHFIFTCRIRTPVEYFWKNFLTSWFWTLPFVALFGACSPDRCHLSPWLVH